MIKIGTIIKILLLVIIIPRNNSFIINKREIICKNLRVRGKMFLKNTKTNKTKGAIITNLSNIVIDDLSNDLLYMLKFYNLTNDEENSYFYIVLYELISLSIKEDEKKFKQLPISVSNIFLYITVKNVILHNILHHKI